ncbi:hypothetical protein [Asaia sp. HumB]|nr:hypothetical protein [Asaia sp. HumB]MDL2172480.1 hypothetical protein [Asaia sp. HumB]
MNLFAALNKALMGNIDNQTRLKVVVPSELSAGHDLHQQLRHHP